MKVYSTRCWMECSMRRIKMHEAEHPLSGKKVRIKKGVHDPLQGEVVPGAIYTIEDWWDHMYGESWMDVEDNWAVWQYVQRILRNNIPLNDEVVYGKIGAFGHLVHVTEFEEIADA